MAKAIVQSDPDRADHRFISFVNRFFCGSRLKLTPELYEDILQEFKKEGGSWYRLFRGSPEDVVLIKKLVKRRAHEDPPHADRKSD